MFTTIEGPHRVHLCRVEMVAVARGSSTPRLCPNLVRKVDVSSHSSWFAACRIRWYKTDLPMQEGIRSTGSLTLLDKSKRAVEEVSKNDVFNEKYCLKTGDLLHRFGDGAGMMSHAEPKHVRPIGCA
ncbi:hypothetical protein GE21DRAFT_4476 [Neurospora crassa]|uniref:Uncharacterized protein n=1 Tax=Neurospora crassa (strain ATCC 24698 / 74-OR23-1A / CBS 708.71 / DSM 1257 / FGSC 987) TaxID=367110 RepID=Q7RXA8_NEUCR|nr:hypothetical protein NCU00179 [Neurospora crassa OR74A]EAA27166.3 hypothetical protein NCU00179 [Neurospora crassa OR74A]KHE89412.1 hypothetical protein GE21DRAFT_4476 [Neurospora crassa]|eukprot:XP_956402.3 hypothetical protein NCU00179 [Neurospora crassa OR74A]